MITFPGEAIAVAICEMITEIVKGQSPEVKEKMWNRYLADTEPFHEAWVKFIKDLPK